jgi:DNA repair protein RadD
MRLHDYQVNAVEDIRQAFRRGDRRVLLVLPTGGGKTVVFSHITKTAADRGKSVVILLHRVELVRQTSQKLTAMGVDHGVIHPEYRPQYYKPVQVASVQSLVRRMTSMGAPDLIIIDEAHHAPAGTWKRVTDTWSDSRCLGVTATPIRSDGKGLKGSFDTLVVGADIQTLIDGGYLVPPEVYSIPSAKFTSEKKRGGDYDKGESAAVMMKPKIVGDVVEHYRRLSDGLPAVAFCCTVEHAELTAREFRSQGYRAVSVDGKMTDEERQRCIGGLSTGDVQVLCSCDLISEGTDIPAIMTAILLRRTASEGLYLQQVGRALRTLHGKTKAIIIDHVGNVRKHGLPDELRQWVLTEDKYTARRGSSEATIRVSQCGKCYAAFNPAPVCPSCGAPIEAKVKPPERVEGELELVQAVKKTKRMEVGRARTIADLQQIARERNYAPGWVRKMAEIKNIRG